MSTNTPQIQRTNHFIHKVLADFPVPGEIAANLIRERVQPFCSEELDPDNTLLTTIEYNTDAPFTGAIVQSMTLTEALITNAPVAPGGLVNITEYSMTAPYFNIVPELPRLMDNRIPAVFNEEFITSGWIPPQRYEAIYLRSLPQVYGPDTQLDISPQTFRVAVQSSNFEEAYNNAILAFWDKHQENYKTLMRIAFIEAYLIQFEEFSLTVEERQLAARAAGVAVEKDFSNLTLEDMQAPYVPDAGISLRLLRIHNNEATDILTITDNQSQITLLYIPGNSSPFHGYTNPASMRAKVVSVAKNATQRKALTNHFDPDTVDSGLIYSGVEEALISMSAFPGPAPASGLFNKLLPNTYWDPAQYINNPMYPPLSGDPFDYVTRQVKARISKLMANTIVSPPRHPQGQHPRQPGKRLPAGTPPGAGNALGTVGGILLSDPRPHRDGDWRRRRAQRQSKRHGTHHLRRPECDAGDDSWPHDPGSQPQQPAQAAGQGVQREQRQHQGQYHHHRLNTCNR